jgi:hypothetical protein
MEPTLLRGVDGRLVGRIYFLRKRRRESHSRHGAPPGENNGGAWGSDRDTSNTG